MQWSGSALLGCSEPAVVVRDFLTLSTVFLLLSMKFANRRRRTPRLRSYRLARIFGKFLANGFFSESPATGKSENHRINTGDLWWAWVDLNHRPRPYQGSGCHMFEYFIIIIVGILMEPRSESGQPLAQFLGRLPKDHPWFLTLAGVK